MLKLYGHPKSRAFRVLWLLEELKLPFEHDPIYWENGDTRRPEFLKLNPAGKVPVLVDGGKVIHETAAILLHIVDNYAAGTSFALTNETRTAVYQWLFYGASELEQGLWTAARHTFVLPEAERIPAAIQWGLQDFRNQLNYVSTMLGTKSYLLGDPFTVADLFITTILAWGKQAQKVDLEYENVKAYFERCQNRPGYQDSVAKYRRKS